MHLPRLTTIIPGGDPDRPGRYQVGDTAVTVEGVPGRWSLTAAKHSPTGAWLRAQDLTGRFFPTRARALEAYVAQAAAAGSPDPVAEEELVRMKPAGSLSRFRTVDRQFGVVGRRGRWKVIALIGPRTGMAGEEIAVVSTVAAACSWIAAARI